HQARTAGTVHLEADVNRSTVGGEKGRSLLRGRYRLHVEADSGLVEEGQELAVLRLADQRIGNVEVVEAGVDHGLGLPDLCDGQASGAELELARGDLAGLV